MYRSSAAIKIDGNAKCIVRNPRSPRDRVRTNNHVTAEASASAAVSVFNSHFPSHIAQSRPRAMKHATVCNSKHVCARAVILLGGSPFAGRQNQSSVLNLRLDRADNSPCVRPGRSQAHNRTRLPSPTNPRPTHAPDRPPTCCSLWAHQPLPHLTHTMSGGVPCFKPSQLLPNAQEAIAVSRSECGPLAFTLSV